MQRGRSMWILSCVGTWDKVLKGRMRKSEREVWAFGLHVEKEVGSWLGKEEHAYSQPGWLSHRWSLPADSLLWSSACVRPQCFPPGWMDRGNIRKSLPASSVANDIWMLLFVKGRLFRAIPGSAEVCSLFEVWDILFSHKDLVYWLRLLSSLLWGQIYCKSVHGLNEVQRVIVKRWWVHYVCNSRKIIVLKCKACLRFTGVKACSAFVYGLLISVLGRVPQIVCQRTLIQLLLGSFSNCYWAVAMCVSRWLCEVVSLWLAQMGEGARKMRSW